MSDSSWYDAGEVKPRNIFANPRCPDCKTGADVPPRAQVGTLHCDIAGWRSLPVQGAPSTVSQKSSYGRLMSSYGV